MNNRLSTVSLRRLHVFLAVCETLHMARAAEGLGITQPALSQQIQGLEQALGVRLFHRRKRSIDLTTAGEACRAEAEKLLAAHAGLVQTVRRTARGEVGQLNIGYVGSILQGRLFPAHLKAMQEKFPHVHLLWRQESYFQLLAAIENGELDVALVGGPTEINAPLAHRFYSRQELRVALPWNHPLAKLEYIPVTRLAGEAMIGLGLEDMGASLVISRLAAAEGVKLDYRWTVSEFSGVIGLVAAGFGCGIIPQDLARIVTDDVVVRPLGPAKVYSEYWLVWSKQRVTPALTQFMGLVAPG